MVFPIDTGDRSPLEALSKARFLGGTYSYEHVEVVATGSRVRILQNNPNRVFWILTVENIYDIRVSMDPTVSSTTGFLVAGSGGVMSMSYEEDGEVVGKELYGIAVNANANVRVMEVIRQ